MALTTFTFFWHGPRNVCVIQYNCELFVFACVYMCVHALCIVCVCVCMDMYVCVCVCRETMPGCSSSEPTRQQLNARPSRK